MVENMIYRIESKITAEEIHQKFASACENHKFSLLQTYDYFQILESKGFPIQRKAFVFEICQAKVASEMLTQFPHFSIFMPCRISIYEENDKTVISTMNMDLVLDSLSSSPELHQNAKNLFGAIKSLMHTFL